VTGLAVTARGHRVFDFGPCGTTSGR
jgi:hypothetical protein